MSETTETQELLARIDALQDLLSCYRMNKRPTEALFKRLDKTSASEDRIRRGMR